MSPPQYTFVSADGSVNVDTVGIAEGYATSGLLDCYRREGIDGVNVDGLENGLRVRENDGGIARDVGLEFRSIE